MLMSKMTMRYIGGGHRRWYRLSGFQTWEARCWGLVKTIEYDPNRTARIALCITKTGEAIHHCSRRFEIGQKILSGRNALLKSKARCICQDIPLGRLIHNIELRPGQRWWIARSAGTYAQLAARDGKYVVLKMPSGETRNDSDVSLPCYNRNCIHRSISRGKSWCAGRSRWMGRRPRVRGVV